MFSGREKAIPVSSTARAYHFGKLGVSLIGGTISEALLQNLGMRSSHSELK